MDLRQIEEKLPSSHQTKRTLRNTHFRKYCFVFKLVYLETLNQRVSLRSCSMETELLDPLWWFVLHLDPVVYWELDHSTYPLSWQIRLQITVIQMVPFFPCFMLKRTERRGRGWRGGGWKKACKIYLQSLPSKDIFFASDFMVVINSASLQQQWMKWYFALHSIPLFSPESLVTPA